MKILTINEFKEKGIDLYEITYPHLQSLHLIPNKITSLIRIQMDISVHFKDTELLHRTRGK